MQTTHGHASVVAINLCVLVSYLVSFAIPHHAFIPILFDVSICQPNSARCHHSSAVCLRIVNHTAWYEWEERREKNNEKMPNKNHSVHCLLTYREPSTRVSCANSMVHFINCRCRWLIVVVQRSTTRTKSLHSKWKMENLFRWNMELSMLLVLHIAASAVLRYHGRNHLLREFTLCSQTANIN